MHQTAFDLFNYAVHVLKWPTKTIRMQEPFTKQPVLMEEVHAMNLSLHELSLLHSVKNELQTSGLRYNSPQFLESIPWSIVRTESLVLVNNVNDDNIDEEQKAAANRYKIEKGGQIKIVHALATDVTLDPDQLKSIARFFLPGESASSSIPMIQIETNAQVIYGSMDQVVDFQRYPVTDSESILETELIENLGEEEFFKQSALSPYANVTHYNLPLNAHQITDVYCFLLEAVDPVGLQKSVSDLENVVAEIISHISPTCLSDLVFSSGETSFLMLVLGAALTCKPINWQILEFLWQHSIHQAGHVNTMFDQELITKRYGIKVAQTSNNRLLPLVEFVDPYNYKLIQWCHANGLTQAQHM